MVVCKFFLQGNCRFGENCRNEHPRDNRNQNRFGALSGSTDSRKNDSRRTDWQITTEQVKVDLHNGRDGRPKWILSAYGPGRDAPASLFQENEFSPEEIRARFYEFAQNGKQDDADQEAIALWSKADQSMNEVLAKAGDVIRFMREADQKRPNREDLTTMDGTKSREQFEKEWAEQSSAQSTGVGTTSNSNPFASGSGSSAFGRPALGQGSFGSAQNSSPFGQKSDNPFAKPAASTFGQPSQPSSGFGQPTFGSTGSGPAASSNPFAKPAAATFGQAGGASPFGQPSQPSSGFGQPAFGSTGFGQASNANPFAKPAASTFGQPSQPASAFGQPSQPASAFGQPSQPASAFGQSSQPAAAFGQSSQPASAFGQPSQPSTSFGQSPFGQPGFGQASQPSAFGQPSQPTSTFGQSSQAGSFGTASPFGQVQAKPAFGQPSAFGQTPPSSGFGQAVSSPSPFAQPGPQTSPFGQPPGPANASPFGTSDEAPNDIPMSPTSPAGALQTQRPNPFGASSTASPFAVQAQPQTGAGAVQAPTAPLPPAIPTSIPGHARALQSFRGCAVQYVEISPGYTRPCVQRADGRGLEQVWFPRGSQEKDVMALGAKVEDLVGERDAYTDEIQMEYRYLLENGRFKDGLIPMVPPTRDVVAYDF